VLVVPRQVTELLKFSQPVPTLSPSNQLNLLDLQLIPIRWPHLSLLLERIPSYAQKLFKLLSVMPIELSLT
jgi:hypothetical protein